MGKHKRHHYVPQFYLKRFVDPSGKLWVWERDTGRTFQSAPGSVAAESYMYDVAGLVPQGADPSLMEKQLSDNEAEVATITGQWLNRIDRAEGSEEIPIPHINREIVALFLTLQFLRTPESRSVLMLFLKHAGVDCHDERLVHSELLWDEGFIAPFIEHLIDGIWMFGRNQTDVPFVTSDNPVLFRTDDSRRWIKAGVIGLAYLVYPLSPRVVMYVFPNEGRWRDANMSRWDCCVSPVSFTTSMVESENSGQVFSANRFLFSTRDDFTAEGKFASTIGTDIYATPPAKS